MISRREGSVSRRGIFRSWCGRVRRVWGVGGRIVMGRGACRGGWLFVSTGTLFLEFHVSLF